jgi:hypothetical protein
MSDPYGRQGGIQQEPWLKMSTLLGPIQREPGKLRLDQPDQKPAHHQNHSLQTYVPTPGPGVFRLFVGAEIRAQF